MDVADHVRKKNVPIKFWGVVVDQNDMPLPDVVVRLAVRQWYVASPSNVEPQFDKHEKITGADGAFDLSNGQGDVLTVESVEKPGYVLSSKAGRTFGYNISTNFIPDPSRPTIFKMWKRGEAQPLITHYLSRAGIPCDGEAAYFDLMQGKKTSGQGDLIVRFRRNPVRLLPGIRRYDWAIEFEMPQGGLLETNDEFMFMAPEEGYKSTLKIEMPKDSPEWKPRLDRQFFIRLRNGQYGRLVLRLSTHYEPPPTGLTMDIAINPSGARSLE
jgi:hypothetical protein